MVGFWGGRSAQGAGGSTEGAAPGGFGVVAGLRWVRLLLRLHRCASRRPSPARCGIPRSAWRGLNGRDGVAVGGARINLGPRRCLLRRRLLLGRQGRLRSCRCRHALGPFALRAARHRRSPTRIPYATRTLRIPRSPRRLAWPARCPRSLPIQTFLRGLRRSRSTRPTPRRQRRIAVSWRDCRSC